jgi:hypothetical protein
MYVFCVYEYSSTANLINLICDTVGLISYIYSTVGLGLISYIYSTVGLGLISYINSTVGLISNTLRIWVSKSGVLKNVFILSKHGTKANIRSTKMANNRHAFFGRF